MQRLAKCPHCGKEKKFDCVCDYGKLMKMAMEPNERQKILFIKKFCPKCGAKCSSMTCSQCQFSFSEEDLWNVRYWK